MRSFKNIFMASVLLMFAGGANATILTSDGTCGNVTITPSYDACAGFFAGNDANQQADVLDTLNDTWGPEWTFLSDSKLDNGGSLVTGTYFSLASTDSSETGTLTFLSAFDPYQTGYDVVLSFKAGNQFSLYRYDADFNIGSLDWDTDTGIDTSAMSHGSIFLRENAVPEPSILAIFGLGLVGLVFVRRRKVQS